MSYGRTAKTNRGKRTTVTDMLPETPALGWSPFHVAAEDYYHVGYLPIPLPEGKKFPPPYGVPNEVEYTEGQLEEWLAGRYTNKKGEVRQDDRPKNIGCIVPDGVVVFDIDGAAAKESLIEFEEQYGPLPPTWASYRGDTNRYHLWYMTPAGLKWPGKLVNGIDIIYRHYRYMVLPPSLHPDGGQYRWANLKGGLHISNGYFPAPDEFSDLPEAWLVLADGSGFRNRPRADLDARMWLREYGTGDMCPEMKRVTNLHVRTLRQAADAGGMHDAMVNGVWSILAEVSQGHSGGTRAMKRFRSTFLDQADASGRREEGAPETEWERACIGAVEKTAIELVRQGDPCSVEEQERGKDPSRFFDPKHGLRARTLRAAVERTGKLAVGPGRIIYRDHNGLWTPDGEGEIYRRTTKLLGERYRPSHASNVLSVIASREPTITDDRTDTQYLNVPNGLLDWRTGELIPHSPHVVSTVRIPVPWDPDAECPDIDQFFAEVFPSDAIELAYEILGYMLYNDNPLHKAILLYGSGRNGKGTFIRLARQLVGHSNISAVTPQDLDSSQFSSAQLHGKLANLVGDVDPRIFKSTEKFKQLTGGDHIMAQHKHKDPFVFRCRALMIAAFNALPRTADTTEGFFSRWVVVPFSAFFPAGKADPSLIHRLTSPSNLQGLLRLSVNGLQNVMARGAFKLPESVRQATERFKTEADPMRGFIEEEVVKDASAYVARPDVYSRYTSWAARNGFSAMSASRFYEGFLMASSDVMGIALDVRTRNGTRVINGIRLR